MQSDRTVKQWAETRPDVVSNLHFRWTIDDFSFYQDCDLSTRIDSPLFSLNVKNDIKWRLILFPKHEQNPDCLSIYLQLESEIRDKSKVAGKYTIGILSHGSQRLSEKFNVSCLKLHQPVGKPRCIKKSTLFGEPNGYLPGDKLKIFCEFRFVTENVSVSSQKNLGKFKIPECKITDDFGSLLGSRKFSDITLVVDEHEFRAHKAILAARSDVFAAMFEHDMEELKTGRVNIIDISQEVLQELLIFIYTGESPNIKEMANHLLAAADKYALEKLKVMSEKAIFDQVSKETALDTLMLADLYSAHQLKHETLQFIKTHAVHILGTEAWQKMKNSNANFSLITDVLEATL